MNTEHVFVMALDDFHEAMLKRLRGAEHLAFHSLLDRSTAVDTSHYDVPALLQRARQQLQNAPHPADAIVGYWDFPTSTLLPVLRRELKLPGPTLESTLRCEHKYWARLEQQKVSPKETPRFALVNPFASEVLDKPPLPYPFWIKPVRSHSSQLGFRVSDATSYAEAIRKICDRIQFLAEPFTYLMGLADLPPDMATIDGWHCIAEEIVSTGRQCTLEGYVLDGEVTIYGIVDSLREGEVGSSFSRYHYPSTMPENICQIMADDTRAFIRQVGFDNSPFNVEFFYEEESQRLWMLEVNTRCSKSHSPLFEMVEGVSNLQAMVDVALGRPPQFPPEGGRFNQAAKFMLREFSNGRVARSPSLEEVRAIEAELPGTLIQVEAETGMLLSDLLHQDSYSYQIATLFIGGNSETEIQDKSRRIRERLPFQFDRGDNDLPPPSNHHPHKENQP